MMGALTSLMYTFRLPVLLIISWRGEPGHADEPQHELMGQITCRSLDLLGVRHIPFPSTLDELRDGVETSAPVHEKLFIAICLRFEPRGHVVSR